MINNCTNHTFMVLEESRNDWRYKNFLIQLVKLLGGAALIEMVFIINKILIHIPFLYL
jgi:hypothetical protein